MPAHGVRSEVGSTERRIGNQKRLGRKQTHHRVEEPQGRTTGLALKFRFEPSAKEFRHGILDFLELSLEEMVHTFDPMKPLRLIE